MSNLKCPLQNSPDGLHDCVESDCSWWDKYRKGCIVLSLGNAITLAQKFGLGSKKPGGWGPKKGGDEPGEF